MVRRIQPLDGLRGIAVLSVMVMHFFGSEETISRHPDWIAKSIMGVVRAGWFGVDLFFALSGFLITGILLRSKNNPFYFRSFYIRRSFRIFPVYYVVLAMILLGTTVLYPIFNRFKFAALEDVCSTQWLHWIYASLVAIFLDSSIHLGPFGHFWSLAVEEHFYVLWPLVVFVTSRTALPWVCVAIGISSAVLRGFFVGQGWVEAAYCFTPCRLDALAYGGLLACMSTMDANFWKPSSKALWLVFFFTMASIAMTGIFLGRLEYQNRFVLAYTIPLVSIAATCLIGIAVSSTEESTVHRALAHPALTFFGKYSYAMYIFHMPLVLLLPRLTRIPLFGNSTFETLLFHSASTLVGIFVTSVVAMVSWRLVEAPAMRIRDLIHERFCRGAAS
ncbi:MAG: acyltransferase [Pirellula sp.]